MKNIEDFFKRKLQNKGFPYSDAYWNEMETMLPKKKKKKRVLVYWLLAGTLVFTLPVFWKTNKNSVLNKIDAPKVVSHSMPSNKMENKLATTEKNLGNKEHHSKNVGILKPSSENTKRTTFIKPSQKHYILDYNTEKEPTIDRLDAETTMEQSIEHLQDERNSHNFIDSFTKSYTYNLLKLFDLKAKGFSLFVRNSKAESKNLLNEVPNPIVKPNTDSSEMWSYYIGGSYDFNVYKRKSEKTQVNENTLNSHGFALNFSMKRKKITFKTGLSFLQLVENTNYVNEQIEYQYDTIYKMVNPQYGSTPNGSKLALIRRQINETQIFSYSIDNPNSRVFFTYIRIPLLVAYEFPVKKIKLITQSGLSSSILLNKRGNYTTQVNNSYKVKNTKETDDLKQTLFHFIAGIGAECNLNKKWSIQTTYSVSMPLNSAIKSYTQKPVIQTFSFGLVCKM